MIRLVVLVEIAKDFAQKLVVDHQGAEESVRKYYEDRFHQICILLDDLNRGAE